MRVALVIEDDMAVRQAIVGALHDAGYGVCEWASGDLIPNLPGLDVIVSDVVTRPEVEHLRAWSEALWERLGVPLVLVTARAEIVAAGASAVGVADVIAKPFDVADLVGRVERAIAFNEEPRAA